MALLGWEDFGSVRSATGDDQHSSPVLRTGRAPCPVVLETRSPPPRTHYPRVWGKGKEEVLLVLNPRMFVNRNLREEGRFSMLDGGSDREGDDRDEIAGSP